MDADTGATFDTPANGDPVRILIIEEEAHFGTRRVETDDVRVDVTTLSRPVVVTGEVERGVLQVERVKVEREVAEAPQPREEDGVLIYPVVEERAVLVKRLFVVEEVRVTRAVATRPVELQTEVREQRVTVEHRSPAPTGEING